jgi:uncharacterized protein YjbI with pentapeptide repeats
VAVLAGALLAFQQLTEDRQQATATHQLTLQGQASERFTRAIDQLGSDRREVQLGGIYGLEQIAQQAARDNRLAVAEVLVAYLHRRAPRRAQPPPDATSVDELRIRAPDVQAALTVLGRRETVATDPPLDLRTLDLRHADLRGAILRDADLRGADLRSADLSDADLRAVDLQSATLSAAYLNRAVLHDALLTRADLHGTDLYDANLHDANLSGANFRFASLNGADLRGAVFNDADLRGAVFNDADLRAAYLNDADLRGAVLLGTDLRGASLRDASLRGARLLHADLRDADLRGADLRGATADQSTIWPDRFDWQGRGVQQEQHSPRP